MPIAIPSIVLLLSFSLNIITEAIVDISTTPLFTKGNCITAGIRLARIIPDSFPPHSAIPLIITINNRFL